MMILPVYPGEVSVRLEDGRLSRAQRSAIGKIAAGDPHGEVLGLDAKLRPVLRAAMPGPARVTEFALLRNGSPTKVTMPMVEEWH